MKNQKKWKIPLEQQKCQKIWILFPHPLKAGWKMKKNQNTWIYIISFKINSVFFFFDK